MARDIVRGMIDSSDKGTLTPPGDGPTSTGRDWLAEYAQKAGLSQKARISVRDWLAETLLGDEFALLGQGGHTETQVPLRRVFVDLPIGKRPGETQSAKGREPLPLFLATLREHPPRDLERCYNDGEGLAPWDDDDIDQARQEQSQGYDQGQSQEQSQGQGQEHPQPDAEAFRDPPLDGDGLPGGLPDSLPNSLPNSLIDGGGFRSATRRHSAGFLLIGGPGQGKSTLGQLACQLHRVALLQTLSARLSGAVRTAMAPFLEDREYDDDDAGLVLPAQPMLPIRIALPEASTWLATAEHQSDGAEPHAELGDRDNIAALIQFLVSRASAREARLAADSLVALMAVMPAVLVLDGLDEIGAAEDRDRIVSATRELLASMAARGGRAVIVMTTRPQGYTGDAARMGVGLRTRYLAPLDAAGALRYARKLVAAKIQGAEQQEKILRRLQAAADKPATAHLLRTPLQVTILAMLVQRGRAPNERWTLFRRYFDITYQREIERETYASELLAQHEVHIVEVHRRVALLLQVEAEGAGGAVARMKRERLRSIVDTVLAEEEIADDERAELVRDIVDAAERRLVFLVEPEPGHFGYEIRSLQEFMAAWACSEGAEDIVEARLLQIAKAPMFRNVVLFMSSRFFSEKSTLRDSLAERICPALDQQLSEQPSLVDDAAYLIRAGAELALEVLEEGSVGNQPKRARALMEQAVRLLELPPDVQHRQLAWLTNGDTEGVLRAALTEHVGKPWPDSETAWGCLLAAIDAEHTWAVELADAHWDTLECPVKLLHLGNEVGTMHGRWMRKKIEEAPEKFPPRLCFDKGLGRYVPFRDQAQATDWTQALQGIRWRLFGMHFLSQRESQVWEPLTSMPSPPPCWQAWVAAAEFHVTPSKRVLAKTLRTAAEIQTRAKRDLKHLVRFAVWPLAASLVMAETSDDLLRFADMAINGELGDTDDWYMEEKQWRRPIEPRALIDAIDDRRPWTHESLALGKPMIVINPSDFIWIARNSKEREGLLQYIAMRLESSRSPIARHLLVTIFIELWAKVFTQVEVTDDTLVGWVKTAEIENVDIYNRPNDIPVVDWVQTLILLRQCNGLRDYAAALNAYIEKPDHRGLLAWTAGKDMVLMESIQEFDFQSNMERLAKVLLQQSYDTLPARADAAVLRAWSNAVINDGQLRDLLQDITAFADTDPSIWRRFVSAVRYGHLPDQSKLILLAQCYPVLPRDQRAYAIRTIREAIGKTRRSSLTDAAVWDRLQFPRPHPGLPVVAQRGATLPESPVLLQKLHIHGVRGIADLALQFPTNPADQGQWIFFLGPNGAGKTTLLRSLVLALRDLRDPKIWPKGTFATPYLTNQGTGEAVIEIELAQQGTFTTRIRQNGPESFSQSHTSGRLPFVPLFAYGCRRGSALGGAQRAVDLDEDDGPEVATLFDEAAPLIHAESWLIAWDGDAARNPDRDKVYQAILAALKRLLDVADIYVRDKRVWIGQHHGPDILLAALSDGYLTTAGWFLDLIARWISLAERHRVPIDEHFMARMTGLVLLDEIDLHLHPTWQIESVGRTRALLPKMSFVSTTHNPLTLVGARPEEIWILSLEQGQIRAAQGSEAPMLLTGGQIFSRYFGIRDLYPHELGKKLRRYGFLSGYAERDDAEQAEMETLRTDLMQAGIDLDWDEVPRTPTKPPGKRS